MRVLQSQCTKIHFQAFVGNAIRDITQDIVVIPLSDIAEAVSLESREKLRGFELLQKNVLTSMYHPVVLVANTKDNYNKALKQVHTDFHEEYFPNKKYLCLFGNQRLAIAHKNNYDAISAVFCENVEEAIVIGKYNEGSVR